LEFAQKLDVADPLKNFRDKFYFPQHNHKDVLYFTGNSLGLQPKSVGDYIIEELNSWRDYGVEGHFRGKRPWYHYHKFSKKSLANILGANESEVVAMNSLTTNLHLLMVTFYKPDSDRFKIIMESGAFPSDKYMVETQVRYHGFDPDKAIVEVKPRTSQYCLQDEDIQDVISQHADNLALVLFSGVQFYTGQLFDIPNITRAAHEAGAFAAFDLAHAAGNVLLNLHDDDVDFASWCSYKYLNSGPGNTSGIFIHDKHGQNVNLPRFGGWWGHNEEKRFQMETGFLPMKGADGWQTSNVNVLSTSAHLASLELFDSAQMTSLRDKSIKLTGFLEFVLTDTCNDHISIITPRSPEQRGCQLSMVIHQNGKNVFENLSKDGVVADWREPDVIRVAPVPLYNSFQDVYNFGISLQKSLGI